METYTTEEEQVEALRRWWQENGRSTLAGIALALVAAFGWQGWQKHNHEQAEQASDMYQSMLEAVSSAVQDPARAGAATRLAGELKAQYSGTTYAQFAALHLAGLAVADGDLATAQTELRWVLSKADSGGDIATVAQQRLARVLAADGDVEQALKLLATKDEGPYTASYALARGDILLSQGRNDEAQAAYTTARDLAGQYPDQINLASLENKLQSLNPVPPRELGTTADASSQED